MGWLNVTVAALVIGAAPDLGDRTLVRTATVSAPPPVVTVVAVSFEVDDPQVAARRLEAALLARLKPLELRFRGDARMRRLGAVIGVGAVALGALRREQPLMAAGSGVLRFGLNRQLSAIQRTTGFSVSPRLERRGFSLVLTRTFE